MTTPLTSKSCVPCHTGTGALSDQEQCSLAREVPDWKNIEGKQIQREYKFKSYLDGVAWVQQAGALSDQQDHHPDIHLFYRRVVVDLWTHSVNGLSENDYILAAKLEESYASFPGKR